MSIRKWHDRGSKSDEEVMAATLRAVSAHGVSATDARARRRRGRPRTIDAGGALRLQARAAAGGGQEHGPSDRAPGARGRRLAAWRGRVAIAWRGRIAVVRRGGVAAWRSASPSPGGAASPLRVAPARAPRDAAVDFLVGLARSVGDRRAFAHHLAFLELDVADPEFRAAAAEYVAAVLARLEAFGLPAREARALYVAYNGALVLWALTGEGPLEDALRRDLSHSPEPAGASTSPSA